MKKLYLLLSALAVALLPVTTKAQITVQSGVTAAQMASMLVGGGVTVLNPTMNCPDSAKGIFRGVSTLGFDSGVVLTCGRANTNGGTWGVNIPAASGATASTAFASTTTSGTGDPTLQTLTTLALKDACVLEFDFKPTGDTVKFDYRWGSEEYTSYACSNLFNDVFGFFISGPGYPTATNIAKVPGTNIPVCINSINCGATGGNPLANCTALGPGAPFCTYYVNNSTGNTITYDGLTTTLTAIGSVTPCDTYHLKMGVADATDQALDSGVFLKAGSLSSTSVHVSPIGTNPLDTGIASQFCVRGCIPGKFVFSRASASGVPMTIKYSIGGTAINGTDYNTIADSIVIPAGSSTGVVNIYGIPVSPAVGPKTVKLYILTAFTCGGSPVIADSAILTIYDSFAVKILTHDTNICLGQNVQINATADPSLDLLWNSSPGGSLSSDTVLNPIATPTVTTTYTLTGVYPGPGCRPSKSVFTINVFPPPTIFVGDPIKKTCLGQDPALKVNVVAYPPASYYSYQWSANPTSFNSSVIPSTSPNPEIKPLHTNSASGSDLDTGNVVYTVTASVNGVALGCKTSASFTVHILPNDFTQHSFDTIVCYPPTPFPVSFDGPSEFEYSWTPTLGVADPHSTQTTIQPPPVGPTTYTLSATSLPGCVIPSKTIQYSIVHPEVSILTGHTQGGTDTTLCPMLPTPLVVYFGENKEPAVITWTGARTDLLSATDIKDPKFYTTDPGSYYYQIIIEDGPGNACKDSDYVTFIVSPPVVITASPHTLGFDSTFIDLGKEIQLNCIRLSPDPVFYFWTPDNGTLTNPNINNPVAKPTETTIYTVYAMNKYGCRDTAAIKVVVDPNTDEFIPTAFTPNGDGQNDIFRLNLKFQKLVDFRVFNRWGQVVYQNTSDAKQGWDGTKDGVPQDMGVYNYLITLQRPNGENKVYRGDVTLIR